MRLGDRVGAGDPGRPDPADQRQDRRGRAGPPRRRDRAHPGPPGRGGRPAPGPHLRLVLRQLPGRGVVGPGDERRAEDGWPPAVHAGRSHPRRRRGRRPPSRPHPGGVAGPGRDRVPHRGHQGRARGPLGRDGHRGIPSRGRGARRVPRPEADGLLRALPDRRRPVLRPARRPAEARAQRRQLHVRAGDLGGARVRVPLRLPRAAPHGDHPRAPRPRVQPRPDRHIAVGRLPGPQDRRDPRGGAQPRRPPARHRDRLDRGADAHVHDPHAQGLHGHDHGPLPDPAGRDEEDRVPLAGADGARVRRAARRGRARLLRPAQEPDAGLRLARLRVGRLPPLRPGEGRRAAEQRARRRVLHDPAPRPGAGLRQEDLREAART